MHAWSAECCARCCHHHVFGEKYKSCNYEPVRNKIMIQEEEEQKNERQRFDAAFDAHQKRIRSFCAVVERKMLPEIRSIVYEYLLSHCTTQHVAGFPSSRVHGDCRSYFFSRSSMPVDPGRRTDVWRFREYTGDVIGKEIAEAWYRNAHFNIYIGDGLVEEWLSEDVWHCGIVPAELVRSVHVHVPEAACFSLDYKRSYRKHSAGEELKLLHRLGNKKVRLVIELEIMSMEPLLAVADLVYELRSRGFVNVSVRTCCNIDCNIRERGWSGMEAGLGNGLRKDRCFLDCKRRDITYLFDVKKEVFDEMFGGDSVFVEDEASDGSEHRVHWRMAMLRGNPEAVKRYAEYPNGKDKPLLDYS